MKRSFTSTTSVWLSSFLLAVNALAFQTETPETKDIKDGLTMFERVEAGLSTETELAEHSLWFQDYLTKWKPVFAPLQKQESEHFELWTPPGQAFLGDYALPALEKTAAHLEKVLGHRPKGKIRVEIYPNKEDFSIASTLTLETLERSGAIGICKFHRLMIMSPKSLPLGYRWLDALSHEYMHLIINELSYAKAELWLHEGTARYFETSYRADPPEFLTPDQKTKLLEALEKNTLVTFERMSPSMVYLKDQDEVSLAFAEVSHAVSILVAKGGAQSYSKFLSSLRSAKFSDAFKKSFKMSVQAFESWWREKLSQEKWEKSKGTMSDDIRFTRVSEESMIGADVQGKVRLGDKMRQQNLFEGALIEYEKALVEEPDNAVILLKAAKTHMALGLAQEALENLRRATDKNPNYITPHIELARLAPIDEAERHLIEANAINPFDPRIHFMLKDIYLRQGRTADSERESRIYESLTAN